MPDEPDGGSVRRALDEFLSRLARAVAAGLPSPAPPPPPGDTPPVAPPPPEGDEP